MTVINTSGHSPLNILIVDDTPANLKVLSDMLKDFNFKVRPVPSGKLALHAAEKEPPDLIILDIMMPEMDGYEVCRRLKENEKLKEIPVIFISALNETKDIVKGFIAGGTDYITKPFQIEEVKARVDMHLKVHFLQLELQKNAIKLQELNAMKDRFFSIIAHDLKNPLSGIAGVSAMMMKQSQTMKEEKKNQLIQMIHESAQNSFNLLENLLLWARSQKDELKFNPVTLDLSKMIHDCTAFLENMAQHKHIELLHELKESCNAVADYDMILTVIRNLISNAIKFTEPNGTITISCEESADSMILSVKDSGIGMQPEDLEKLFNLDTVSKIGTSKEKGSGLGLVLCKEFVEKNGGKIWVNSEFQKGSEFFFSLPK
ncbi:MAG: hybrid sensor histidine kinase/response regulator [SAR324 cluster bacterium]|nr:hybrid sensor histidine kinase/response regulator [SAR324 cluster bacterium]